MNRARRMIYVAIFWQDSIKCQAAACSEQVQWHFADPTDVCKYLSGWKKFGGNVFGHLQRGKATMLDNQQ